MYPNEMYLKLATRLDVNFSQAVLTVKFHQVVAKAEFFDYIEV